MQTVVFGCGGLFKKKIDEITKIYDIVAIIDNNESENVSYKNEIIPVYNPKIGTGIYPDAKYIVCANDFVSMTEQLIKLGISVKQIDYAYNYEPHDSVMFVNGQKLMITLECFVYLDRDGIEHNFKNMEEYILLKSQIEEKYLKSIKKVPYYDIDNMNLKIVELITSEYVKQNDFYRNAYWIKKYCGMDVHDYIPAAIEHACYMGEDYYCDADLNHDYKSIITLSDKRENVLKRHTDKRIFKIGPGIAYSDFFDSLEKMEIIKKEYGKTLLVFPSHSTDFVLMEYDFDLFLEEIRKIAINFDTVNICLHYSDLLNGNYKIYKDAGFNLVSAGHMYDKWFLPRLKELLYCCDLIMSNDVGSYVGQGALLGKGSFLYKQEYFIKSNEEYIEEYRMRKKDITYNNLFSLFSNPDGIITKKQFKMIDYVWGISYIKSKEELRELLKQL